jgi:hypothetical protein
MTSRAPSAKTAENVERLCAEGVGKAAARDRLVVTFVCPQCGANLDKELARGLCPDPFPCSTTPCGHVFSPPPDFWEHALKALRLGPGPRPRSVHLARPLLLSRDKLARLAAAARGRRGPHPLSLVPIGPYMLHFEWPARGHIGAHPSHALDAETLEQAKLQAAMRYAGASFQPIPPTAYRVLGPTGETLYRYPEPRRRT